MSELPGYYHLSPTQIESLSFHVTLRCIRNSSISTDTDTNNQNDTPRVLSKDIKWQEQISRPSKVSPENHRVCIFTYTNADAVPYEELSSNSNKDELQEGTTFQGFSLRKDIENQPEAKRTHNEEFNDRLHRENPCQIMVIMAAACSSTDFHEEVLCVLKLSQSGLISACPAWSEVEPEDCDDTRVFMSQRGINEVINKGPRLTTYIFSTAPRLVLYAVQSLSGDFCFMHV